MDPNANLHPVGCESSPTESEGTLVEFQDALMEMPQPSLKTPILNLQIPQSNLMTPQFNQKTPQSNLKMPESKTLAGIRRDVENFYCGKCSLWLNDLNALEHHIRTSSVHKPSTEKLPYICAICMGRFPTGETLEAHIENPPWNSVMHATWEEASYAAEYDTEWQWEMIAMQQGGIFCYPCNRLFMSQDSLDQHMVSSTAHKTIPRVNCDACGYSFCDETALAQHLKNSTAHQKGFQVRL